MKKYLMLVVTSLVIAGAGCSTTPATTNQAVSVTTNGVSTTTAATSDTITITNDTTVDTTAAIEYSGNRLAGTVASFLEFNQADYDQAVADNKTIVLDFYANWCPICRAEEPDLFASFDALTDPTVVGFRVNYNDDDTDDVEDALAEQFGVTYQHTKVIVQNGQVKLKTQNTWDETSLADALAEL